MKRRRAEFVIGCFALLLTFAAPASAQLTVKNANPVSGTAGAMLFDSNPQLWTLPTVVRFMDDSTFGVCRPENYRITITWDAASGSLVDEAKIYRTLQPSPVEPRCEYSAQAPGPPVPAAQQPLGGRDYAYTESRDYNYAIQVCRIRPPQCAPAVTNTAHIGDAPYTGMVLPGLSTTNTGSFSGPVALISDKNWYAKPNAFRATINWGDKTGSGPADGIVAVNGAFAVMGSHEYSALPIAARARQSGESPPLDVTVSVEPVTAGTTRSARPRAATGQIFQGNITIPPQPPCPAGASRQSDGSCICPDNRAPVGAECPPPASMTIDLASRSLRTIKRRGLRIRVFGMPITLQYGVVVKMHGRPYCPRRGHGAPPAKLLASPVVKVPQHPADATRTLPPLPINPAKIHLCVGGAYDFTVPARPPVFAAASVRVTLTK